MGHCHEKHVVATDKAPKAIGPYSAGIKAGHFVYTAGQIGLEPESGVMVTGGIEAETRRALKNLQGILKEAGSSLDQVVKTTVFLMDMNDFAVMNSIYAEFFTGICPARSAVQVAGLPKGAKIEIEAVAIVPCQEHAD